MEQGLAQHKPGARVEKESFATRDELARWFFEFYTQQFQAFLDDKDGFALPDQHELRDSFDGSQTSPLQKPAKWRDVTESAAFELIHWAQQARTRHASAELQQFLGEVDQQWMRVSPNILTEVSPSASVLFLGHTLAHEDLRRTVGYHAIGEPNYTTSFGVDSVEPFLASIEKRSGSNEQQLITLLSLPPLVMQAQDEAYSEDLAGTMLPKAIRRWGRNPDRSILQRLVAQQISAELSPTGTPIHAEQAPLAQNTLYTSELGLDTPVVRIARDAVGMLNDVGFLQEIASDAERKVPTDSVDETDLRAYAKQQERLGAIQFLQQNIDLPRSATQTEIDKLAHAHTLLKELPDLAAPESLRRWIELATTIYEAQKAYATTTNQREHASIERRFEAAIGEWRANRHEFFQLRHQVKAFVTSVIDASVQRFGLVKVQGDLLEKQLAKNPAADTEKQASVLRVIHHPSTRAVLEQRLSFPLAELSLREQLRFGEWLLSTNEAAGAATLNTVKRFGPHAARTFLALETDTKHGERILAFANQADPAVAARVFEAFARIADKIDLSAQDLAKHLYKDDGHEVDAERVRQELIKRGSRILLDAEKALAKDPSGASIVGELERYEADTVLFCATWKTASREHSPPFELLRACDIHSFYVGDLSETEVKQKTDMYAQLIQEAWAGERKDATFVALNGLQEGMHNPDTRFFELTWRDAVVAILRIDTLKQPQAFYAGSFATHPKLQESGIGIAFAEAVHAKVAREGLPIVGECVCENPVIQAYTQRFGFAITGINISYGPDGLAIPSYAIRLEAGAKYEPAAQFTGSLKTPSALRAWIRQETDQGRVITRYVIDPKLHTVKLTSSIKVQKPSLPSSTTLQTARAATQPSAHFQ